MAFASARRRSGGSSQAGPPARSDELTDSRHKHATVRLREKPQLEHWRGVVQRINASDFCRGQNERGWVATFDWLLQPDTAVKVLEGKYDNRTHLEKPREAPREYAEGRVRL